MPANPGAVLAARCSSSG